MNMQELNESADQASDFLKLMSNASRLRLLCMMMAGERPVGELAAAIGINQSATSQHLAVMRREGLVAARRDGQMIYYRVVNENVAKLLTLLSGIYCPR